MSADFWRGFIVAFLLITVAQGCRELFLSWFRKRYVRIDKKGGAE